MVFPLLRDGVRVLVVGLGDAFSFAVHLEEEKDVCEVDAPAPSLFQDAHGCERLLDEEDVHVGLEVRAARDGVDIVVELLDGAVLQHAVEESE